MTKADKRARKRQNQQLARNQRESALKRSRRVKLTKQLSIAAVLVVALVFVLSKTGNDKKKATPTTAAPTTLATTPAKLPAGCVKTKPAKAGNGKQYQTAPTMTIDATKTYTATFSTSCGTFVATLDAKNSPKGVNNFVFLARAGFYNGLTWHRAVTDFVIQGGDPQGTGSGGPGYSVVTEWPKKGYVTGDLAWAKASSEAPGAAGSQFFVVTGSPAALNGTKQADGTYAYGYFGHVTSGLANAKKIESLSPGDGAPRIPMYVFSITITEK